MHFSYEAPDSKTGLIMDDFESERVSGHEGRSPGKTDPPGGRERHASFFGNGAVFRNQTNCEPTVSRKGQRRKA